MKAIKKPTMVDFVFAEEDGEVEALGGKVSYSKGDAIITGIKGEKYPCRRDIFDETYIRIEPLTDSDYEITDEEESKAMAQNNPDIVRFVKMKTGLWLRQDNDIFPSHLLFSENILFYLMAVSPWNDQIDYVDFHMRSTERKTSINTGENLYYKQYWNTLNTVFGCFYVPSKESIVSKERTYVKRKEPLSYSELADMVKMIGIDDAALKLIIEALIRWGLVYDCTPTDSEEQFFRLVE